MSHEPAGTFVAICKIEYTPVSDDHDEVIPGNIGALRMGLEALQKEDASDYARAEQLWAKAQDLLAKEVEDDTGAGAEFVVTIADDFAMHQLGVGL